MSAVAEADVLLLGHRSGFEGEDKTRPEENFIIQIVIEIG